MKNSYEILSPFFLKFTGFCVSVYLCILCVRLFILNPRYAYWQLNAFLVWPIILGAFILCVCFAMFILAKMNNSRVYLSSMYLLYCIKCILFLIILNTRAYTLINANIMLKIALCFGFLFIFLEYLHAQTSLDFFKEKTLLSGIMGIVSCLIVFAITVYVIYYDRLSIVYILAFSSIYALRILIFSIIGKETKSSILYKCFFISFLFLLSLFTIPAVPNYNNLERIVVIETLIAFCCTQLIPLKNKQTSEDITISPLQKLVSCFYPKLYYEEDKVVNSNVKHHQAFIMIKGMFMLALRFIFFALLATGVANIWRGY